MPRAAMIAPSQLAFDLLPADAMPTPLALVVSNAAIASLPATSEIDPKQVRAREKQATKLRAAGETIVERAEAALRVPRLANTARRARMAASSERQHENALALGKTMINLAEAIKSGEALNLGGISTRAAVETLAHALDCAKVKGSAGEDIFAVIERHAEINYPRWGISGSCVESAIRVLTKAGASADVIDPIRGSEAITQDTVDALIQLCGRNEAEYQLGWYNVSRLQDVARLKRAGISSNEQLKAALKDLVSFSAERKAACPVTKALRALVGRRVGFDFFPTPAQVAKMMAERAGIRAGMVVFEPSAGCGNLADAARDVGGKVQCLEISDDLREILTLKGHTLIGRCFDEFEASPFANVVLMNPPFSNRIDCAHIRKAYECLLPGGVLVAIACEGTFGGSDKAAVSFRTWLEELEAEIEKLPQGTFMDPSLPVRTGVNARLITILKP
jgi:hypothetical protein